MRRLPILVALLAGLLMPSLGHAAASVADLRANDVVFDAGVNRPAADRERLQSAADELRGKSFPTKFVVVARAPKNIDALAATLRRGLAKQVGIDNIDAVLVLAPHQLGVNADVFETERATAVQEALPTLKTDEIAGTILLANRLQQFDAAVAPRLCDLDVERRRSLRLGHRRPRGRRTRCAGRGRPGAPRLEAGRRPERDGRARAPGRRLTRRPARVPYVARTPQMTTADPRVSRRTRRSSIPAARCMSTTSAIG